VEAIKNKNTMENHGAYAWLGDEFLNGTFTDVADLDADMAEIEALLALYEDVSCSK
jgi:hypothetical protein